MKMRELELIKEHSIEFGPQEVWLWELLYIYIYTYVYIYIYIYVCIYIYIYRVIHLCLVGSGEDKMNLKFRARNYKL
jgi:hypothetical protein